MKDIWQYLKETDRPIVMYGTGDGGDKIFAQLDRYGIKVSGVFASDGFVRNRTFHGFQVMPYSKAREQFGDGMIILIAFGSSLPDVLERFFSLAARHETYAPEVPVAGGEVFDLSVYERDLPRIKRARELFCDKESIELYDEMTAYRLDGKMTHLAANLSSEDEAMKEILHPSSYRVTLDLGAYTGDTALKLIGYAPQIETVIALEPDAKNFEKLCRATSNTGKVEPHYAAAWDRREILTFRRGGGRGIRSSDGGKNVEVSGIPAQEFLNGRKVDFIKIDVEGAEKQAIFGCGEAIVAYRPEMQIALYHRSDDIYNIPLMLDSFCERYRFYLRRYPYVPAWDLNLFCVPY